MKVSVIIPTFNSARFLESAIRSVQLQTYEDYEIIVVDDGSTDATQEVVRGFGGLCRYIVQPNSGTAAARNRGIRCASGELVAFLDADDAWAPRKLEAQVRVFRTRPEVGLVETASWLCDEFLRPVRALPPARVRGRAFEDMLLNHKALCASSVVVRRSVLERVGGFDEAFRYIEDRELWLRLARECLFDYLQEPFVYYRVHAGNKLRDGRKILEEHLRILDRYLPCLGSATGEQTENVYRSVERFGIKIMCLNHSYRDALLFIRRHLKTYGFRRAYPVLLYAGALLMPCRLVSRGRRWVWRLRRANYVVPPEKWS